MTSKKIISLLTATAIVGSLGISTVFAQNFAKKGNTDNTTQTQRFGKEAKVELTDEQKAEMDAKKAEMEAAMKVREEKINALTDEQKAEIYAIKEEANKSQLALIDKYLELGLIDSETADNMKTQITERTTQMKENGKVPMLGMGNGMGKPGNRKGGMMGERPALTDEQKVEMKAKLAEKLKVEVEAGKITQEKADEILANCESGKMMGMGMGRGMNR